MPSWRNTLTGAGISDPGLRDDYTHAARRVLRREPAPYLALRLLAAPPLVPWLAAGLAFMNLVDDVAETGSAQRRAAALAALTGRVEAALASGPGEGPDPLLRAYAHAARTRGLPGHWITRFLQGAATAEAGFDGFAAEEDFQAYLDAYAWPGVLVFTGLQYEGGPDAEQAAGWRAFVDAAQRVDFLADLSGDLAEGRLCIPRARLDEHGVTRADLERARDTPAVRGLLAAECLRARTALAATDGILDLAAPGLRPVVATMTELMAHQLTAVERAGSAALRRDIGYGFAAPLRTLARARRARSRAGLRPPAGPGARA
ncbi:squalene/phytoene synthase family protein [Streptomyces sp. NBC_00249]|uniref:squalene/phytoene synthase family protein n=1 Tax=Streptomyces sp. NBC_00249 TaxID=2975690 RepID=UPI0022519DB6|nr:squalene/phytoene synthase family protein [Streptomyces sp. NBC_00249]MCX5192765.1 squalene/phytoene synthase family protein [Streptomyces sp. NBC_00249]